MGNEASYGDNIEGIPLAGSTPQVAGSSAVPNRPESETLANPEGATGLENPTDYFREVEGEIVEVQQPFIQGKDNQRWSDGIEDEENDYGLGSFAELDEDWNEGLFAETQPLHIQEEQIVDVEPAERTDQSEWDVELQPDNLEFGNSEV